MIRWPNLRRGYAIDYAIGAALAAIYVSAWVVASRVPWAIAAALE